MLPDHIQLLREGEAFVALPDELRGSLNTAKEVLAFRNPSYFDGDLRKLKLVHYDDLLLRANERGREWVTKCQGFFKNLTAALVLSTIGSESEAARMSGGDFDGDKAWICFDRDLVEQVAYAEAAVRPDVPVEHPCEATLASDATLVERVKFARHFKKHQRQLGILANILDSAMDLDDYNQSREVDDIARQAFLQVDHPYRLCELKCETSDFIASRKQPHWALNQSLTDDQEHDKAYRSTKALGRLWDHVEATIKCAVALGKEETNRHIHEFANRWYTRTDLNLGELKSKLKTAVIRYKQKMKQLKETKTPVEEMAEISQILAREERGRLIDPLDSEDDRKLAAAILYHECHGAYGFAWKVAAYYLLLIVVSAQNQGKSALPLIMDPEMDKLAFGRRQKTSGSIRKSTFG
jgi:RNA dependent RNA polymerase